MDTNERKRENKGLTLLEVLVAVCLFAIVVTPISASLLTGLKINMRSRTLLTANDVAQSLMESISEKTFEECKNMTTTLGGSPASGFSSIDGNHYNSSTNASNISWDAVKLFISPDKYTTSVTDPDTATITSKANKLFVEDSGAINKVFAKALKTVCSSKKFWYTINPDGNFMYLGYTGINAKGMYFDAVISFLPVPNNETDTWYTYEVFIDVYNYKNAEDADRLTKPTVSIKSGILAKARL